MARFRPGESGNPTGRRRGTRNRVTRELRDLIKSFLESHFEETIVIWEKANPREKLTFFINLLPYILPRMEKASLDISFDQLTENDIDKIINHLLNQPKNENR